MVGRQTDRSYGGGDRDAVVEPQQRQVVFEVQVTELAHDGPEDESGFRFARRVAIIVFAKSDFDQRPKEPDNND